MSNKFEQLLDFLVNEEHDKANELFHEIVVEKSREIYATMIAEEAEEDEEDDSVEEAQEEDEEEESVEEGFGDGEESMYEIGGEDDFGSDDDSSDELGGDAADDFVSDVSMDDDEEGGDSPATKDDVLDIADALEELKAEFQALLAGEKHEEEGNPDIHGGELDDLDQDGDGDHDMKDHDMEDEDEMFMREYRETVKKPSNSETNVNTKSTVSSAKGRPNTDAKANNIAQSATGEDRKAGADGKSLAGNVKGEYTKGVEKNISNKASSSLKNGADLGKVSAGHGAEKKGSGESSVNSKNTLPR